MHVSKSTARWFSSHFYHFDATQCNLLFFRSAAFHMQFALGVSTAIRAVETGQQPQWMNLVSFVGHFWQRILATRG